MTDRTARGAARLATLVALPLALLAGLGAYWLLGGFGRGPAGGDDATSPPGPAATGAVSMPAPALPERAATVCRALLSRLPERADDAPRRPVAAGPEQNAAYGDPALTLACGVPAASVPPTADVFVLSGVCWYPRRAGEVTLWTTIDREVPVQVAVPGREQGSAQRVIEFSGPIVASVPSLPSPPTGCRA